MPVDLDDLLPEVRTHLPGVDDPTAQLYLRRAAKRFCQQSRVWQQLLGTKTVGPPADPEAKVRFPIPSVGEAVTPDDGFVVPDDAYVHSIFRVLLDDDPVAERRYYFDLTNRHLVLEPGTLIQDGAMKVGAILEPTRAAETLPEFIAEQWSEAIIDYAIFEMMSQPKKEWTDPASARTFLAKFQRRVAESRVSISREGTEDSIVLDPIPF